MHIADIDFVDFYRQAFGGSQGAVDFVACVEKITGRECTARLVLHQAARLIWLADRIEECAKGRPALQILFFMYAAEAVAKLVKNFQGEGKSKFHVHIFFKEICTQEHRYILDKAFSVGIDFGYLGYKKAVDFLYDIRCDVTHRGKYFSYTLKDHPDSTPIIADKNNLYIANITIEAIRQIVLEGALMGARISLPDNSISFLKK